MLLRNAEPGIKGLLSERKAGPNVNMLRRLANLIIKEVGDIEESSELQLGNGFKLDAYLEKFEINIIRYALQLAGYNQLAASRLLGIKPTTLNAKIKRYNIMSGIGNGSGKDEWPSHMPGANARSQLADQFSQEPLM
jgi:hypothetical protein